MAISNITKTLVILANLVVLGLGVWFKATELVVLAVAKGGLIIGTFILPKGLYRSAGYAGAAAICVVEVILFRQKVIELDFDLSFGNWFLDLTAGNAFQWIVDLLEGVPEGVSWFTMTASVLLLGLSFFFDQLPSGDLGIGASTESDFPLIVLNPSQKYDQQNICDNENKILSVA
jgi:hypothetical protein